MQPFRPWGQIDWLLGRLKGRAWSMIGCSGTEKRSISLAGHLGRAALHHVRMIEIRDPQPLDLKAVEERLAESRAALAAASYAADEIVPAPLVADLDMITGIVAELVQAGSTRLLIDLTSLPKHWFFPLIRAALAEAAIEDVIACYTAGVGYATTLSENISPLRVLPSFAGDAARDRHGSLIIGIGFEPTALDALLADQQSDAIRLIFPFPPGPPGHHRNWMFVKHIEDLTSKNQIDPPDRVHIHMYDCPQIFDALCAMTDGGTISSAIAPYGPKTMSLAMCLFALAAEAAERPAVPVYYAQPLRYALDYTADAAMRGDAPDAVGYCLRLAGRDLYRVA
ncbi:MAG: hypothetical protein Q8M31_02430 [Beijerinckiaceae bacterium]|nr:hypothetical protein [Beijerinckiaceae bacterium]